MLKKPGYLLSVLQQDIKISKDLKLYFMLINIVFAC